MGSHLLLTHSSVPLPNWMNCPSFSDLPLKPWILCSSALHSVSTTISLTHWSGILVALGEGELRLEVWSGVDLVVLEVAEDDGFGFVVLEVAEEDDVDLVDLVVLEVVETDGFGLVVLGVAEEDGVLLYTTGMAEPLVLEAGLKLNEADEAPELNVPVRGGFKGCDDDCFHGLDDDVGPGISL